MTRRSVDRDTSIGGWLLSACGNFTGDIQQLDWHSGYEFHSVTRAIIQPPAMIHARIEKEDNFVRVTVFLDSQMYTAMTSPRQKFNSAENKMKSVGIKKSRVFPESIVS
ncbi:hypothetical protein KQX54_002412 [Cotesia glomerata]|uniref:Uncharacterized protein n=1 Tax=Cotesia glomerata TaxID=32391 RepID=A0AAV7I2Y2_COTGL|nr:hypothetical protein KQX54_002412 [Cotesia glomerata]